MLPDGSALYFASNRPEYGLYRAAMNGTNAEPAVLVIQGGQRFPVVSQDELTLYYGGDVNGEFELLMATRPSRDVAFGQPMFVPSLNAPGALDQPEGLSPDGCRLYLTRRFPPEISISLVAERIRN